MLAYSEIGPAMLAQSDNGYNVIVGSRPGGMLLFASYADHPRRLIKLNAKLSSTAAGRYQILARYYDAYKITLKLPDFGPSSQDAIAIQMIRECQALADIEAGRVNVAISKCKRIWASLPGAGYGQPEHGAGVLVAAYQAAGGTIWAG